MLMVGDNPGGVEEVTVRPISGRGKTRVDKSSGMIAMAGGGSITAGTTRVNTDNSSKDITMAIIEGMKQAPAPVLGIKEFNNVNDKVVRTTERATL